MLGIVCDQGGFQAQDMGDNQGIVSANRRGFIKQKALQIRKLLGNTDILGVDAMQAFAQLANQGDMLGRIT
ncbi:hypothetical protein [Methyloglobulus sp.]|uniref:hypothetical protein n=1 Tax=Methyloglobulus sp. TaxID=2518622 RepID=UPI0032B7F5AA